jgi:hypothetical protein
VSQGATAHPVACLLTSQGLRPGKAEIFGLELAFASPLVGISRLLGAGLASQIIQPAGTLSLDPSA